MPDHPLLRWFFWTHLPTGPAQEIARRCEFLAESADAQLADGDEKTAGLRKLLEAKDCFVRAALSNDFLADPPV